jgi:hypothetical protein
MPGDELLSDPIEKGKGCGPVPQQACVRVVVKHLDEALPVVIEVK